jgi:hypothetical protein
MVSRGKGGAGRGSGIEDGGPAWPGGKNRSSRTETVQVLPTPGGHGRHCEQLVCHPRQRVGLDSCSVDGTAGNGHGYSASLAESTDLNLATRPTLRLCLVAELTQFDIGGKKI